MGIEEYEKHKREWPLDALERKLLDAVTFTPRDVAQKLAMNRANAVREAEAMIEAAEAERWKAVKLNRATRDGVIICACLLGVTVAAWVFTLHNLASAQRACIATLQANKN